jgi:hypothetical protein
MTDQREENLPRPPRNLVLTAVLAIIGVILLLPGLCAIFFASIMLPDLSGPDMVWVVLWVICLLISVGGVWLIRKTFR